MTDTLFPDLFSAAAFEASPPRPAADPALSRRQAKVAELLVGFLRR